MLDSNGSMKASNMPRSGAYVVVWLGGFDDECRAVPVGWSPDADNAEAIARWLDREWAEPNRRPLRRKPPRGQKVPKELSLNAVRAALMEINAGHGVRQSMGDIFAVESVSAGYPGSQQADIDPVVWDTTLQLLDRSKDDSIDSELRRRFREVYPALPLPYAMGQDTPESRARGSQAEALDENDVAVLEFLARTPTLRRKVVDVLPAKGPQDRKAVARRLRKLADRVPPLVDYPRGSRLGVAILPLGIDALKQAKASTPR